MDWDKRFDKLEAKLDDIDVNVRSLMESRAFTRGVLKGVAVLAGIVSTVVSIIIGWFGVK